MDNEKLCYWLRCNAPVRKDHPMQEAADRIEAQQKELGGYQAANSMFRAKADYVLSMSDKLEAQQARIAELREALSNLSFECDDIWSTRAPSRETYNQTFAVLKKPDDLSALQELRAGYEARIEELREALEMAISAAESLINYSQTSFDEPISPASREDYEVDSLCHELRTTIFSRTDDLSALAAHDAEVRKAALLEVEQYFYNNEWARLPCGHEHIGMTGISDTLRRMAEGN